LTWEDISQFPLAHCLLEKQTALIGWFPVLQR